MRFSSLAGNLTGVKNPLYTLHSRLVGEGRSVVDLVRGNVNAHGIVFPPALLDEILVPHPSYPLFDYIAAMCGIRLVPYRLDEEKDWAIDLGHLEEQIGPKTRAIVLISPHNPTGPVCHAASLQVCAAVPHVERLEMQFRETSWFDALATGSLPQPVAGAIEVPRTPGLGITLDAAALATLAQRVP